MKKFLLFILIVVFSSNIVFASDENLGFRGPLNYIQCKVLEYVISREVKEFTGGYIKVKVDSYGAKALRNGIFKSVALEGRNLNIDGMNISKFSADTITENNRLDVSDYNNLRLITDILAEYTAELTNEDINTIINSKEYKNEIALINKKLSPFLRIYNTSIYSENNRLHIKLWLASDIIGSTFTVSMSTDIYSDGYKAGLNDIKFSKKVKIGISDSVLTVVETLNPINFVIKELDDAKISTSVKSINIVDDKIQISGIIKIYKDR